jgi:Flp pilus assembly protein TadD
MGNLQRSKEARALLDRALRIDPHDREALGMRAYVRAEQGDVVGAASDALKDPRAHRKRAGAYWHLKKLGAAIGDMQSACALGMEIA